MPLGLSQGLWILAEVPLNQVVSDVAVQSEEFFEKSPPASKSTPRVTEDDGPCFGDLVVDGLLTQTEFLNVESINGPLNGQHSAIQQHLNNTLLRDGGLRG